MIRHFVGLDGALATTGGQRVATLSWWRLTLCRPPFGLPEVRGSFRVVHAGARLRAAASVSPLRVTLITCTESHTVRGTVYVVDLARNVGAFVSAGPFTVAGRRPRARGPRG